MSKKRDFSEKIYIDPRFSALVMKRQRMSLVLVGLSMLSFFLIPLISNFVPELFQVPVAGAINVGLVYLIAQYGIGGLVVWRYSAHSANVDNESKALVASFIGADR
ncbi:MAG TPA: DUF485 domain-containing protein [Noviherbaspirillum sp.]|nr:DUF485 domain-containing protein [Noviherbaspirillum sp.]